MAICGNDGASVEGEALIKGAIVLIFETGEPVAVGGDEVGEALVKGAVVLILKTGEPVFNADGTKVLAVGSGVCEIGEPVGFRVL